MSVKVPELTALQKWYRKSKAANLAVETFKETQRRRLIQTNLLAVAITVLTCISEVSLSGPAGAAVHLLVAVPIFLWYFACHSLAMRGRNVQSLARIWIAIGSFGLWIDIGISGGLNANTASMLYLLPIGSALILNVRDIVWVSIANVAAIVVLAAFDIFGTIAGTSAGIIVPQAGLMIVNAVCISATVIILVTHTSRTDRALRNSLTKTLHISEHDELTGLLNRKWINGRLDMLESSHDACRLYLVDLDGFKQVNDLHGHATGDALLRVAADRLKTACPNDASVARLGGDEFFVLIPADVANDGETGKRIVEALATPFYIRDLEIVISGSVGEASFPSDAQSGEQLLAKADVALYAAKMAGRNQYLQFEPSLEEQQLLRNSILKRLRKAIDSHEIHLAYQPQFSLCNGELIGFEALARWDDAELGPVPPDLFIPIAEECGLISDLGEHMLRLACTEAKHWVNLADPKRDIRLSVNLSPLQLSRSDIVSVISGILEETGFPANRLELEITERILIADPDQAQQKLHHLAALGIEVALDDFGKGYSSLSYLQSLSLTRLKIDKAFIANVEEPEGAAFVRAIIQLADALNLPVVAEGIETEDQHDILLEMNCAAAQGFLFSPAVAPQAILKLLLAGRVTPQDFRSTRARSQIA